MPRGLDDTIIGRSDEQVDEGLRDAVRMMILPVEAIGTGGDSNKVRVRIPGEDAATADLALAEVFGAMPLIGDNVLTLLDASTRRVITSGAGAAAVASGAFSAYHGADQLNIADQTFTKVTYTTEDFDVAGWYDTANSRYTPQVAGYYLLTASMSITPAVDAKRILLDIYKNGAGYALLGQQHTAGTTNVGVSGSVVVQANGTTDFFEVFTWHNFGVSTSDINLNDTYKFTGVRVA